MENNTELIAQCEARAKEWLSPAFDEETRKPVQPPIPRITMIRFFLNLKIFLKDDLNLKLKWFHKNGILSKSIFLPAIGAFPVSKLLVFSYILNCIEKFLHYIGKKNQLH